MTDMPLQYIANRLTLSGSRRTGAVEDPGSHLRTGEIRRMGQRPAQRGSRRRNTGSRPQQEGEA